MVDRPQRQKGQPLAAAPAQVFQGTEALSSAPGRAGELAAATRDLTPFQAFQAQQHERLILPGREGTTVLSSLSFNDLQRLRAIVKRVYMRYYPPESFTVDEADRMIETLTPSVREKLIKRFVDGQLETNDDVSKVAEKIL